MTNKMESINFKKAFVIFFIALAVFGVFFAVSMTIGGYWSGGFGGLIERLTFARLRERMFVDTQSTFRFFGLLFLAGFNVLLALWVYVDSKKQNRHRAIWFALTLISGLIGWLVYMIGRLDTVDRTN